MAAALIGPLRKGEILSDIEGGAGTVFFMYLGDDENDVTATVAITANIPATYLSIPLQEWRSEYVGLRTWLVQAQYSVLPLLAIGTTVWETDQTGGSERIYQSFETTGMVPAASTGVLTDFRGAIGVSEDKVEGCEVIGSEIKWTAKRRYVVGDLATNYLQELEALRRHTNAAIFTFTWQGKTYTYQIGEALFLGFRATEVSPTKVEVDHYFSMSRDVTGVIVEGFDVTVSKAGWDHAWFAFKKQGTKHIVVQYNTERVYLRASFAVLRLS